MTVSENFGELYANIYDVIYKNKNYGRECDLLEKLFKNKNSVSTILDLGCGTGGHAAELSKRGYQIVGMDQSPQMIKIAQDKKLSSCEFKLGDIRTFDINQSFDTLILMFNVIGYITDESDLSLIFKQAQRYLTDGGLLIFDFWYAPAVRKNPPTESNQSGFYKGLDVSRRTKGEIVPNSNYVQVNCNLKHGSTTIQENHKVRFFDINELRSLLTQSGFRGINFGQMPDISSPLTTDNWSAVAWAQIQ
jgi:SAM-dependent methyltransferase